MEEKSVNKTGIAERYAEALFMLGKEKKLIDKFSDNLNDVSKFPFFKPSFVTFESP